MLQFLQIRDSKILAGASLRVPQQMYKSPQESLQMTTCKRNGRRLRGGQNRVGTAKMGREELSGRGNGVHLLK